MSVPNHVATVLRHLLGSTPAHEETGHQQQGAQPCLRQRGHNFSPALTLPRNPHALLRVEKQGPQTHNATDLTLIPKCSIPLTHLPQDFLAVTHNLALPR